MNRMQESLLDMELHAYLDVSVVYGRKPGVSQEQASEASIPLFM
jgi:hypothetical protein